MGILSFDIKKIYRKEFKEILRTIPELSKDERDYTYSAFDKALGDGLSKQELKREIQRLSHNPNDSLDPNEVRKIKEKLLGRLQ